MSIGARRSAVMQWHSRFNTSGTALHPGSVAVAPLVPCRPFLVAGLVKSIASSFWAKQGLEKRFKIQAVPSGRALCTEGFRRN